MRSRAVVASVALCAAVAVLVPILGHDALAAKSPALSVEVYPVQNPDPLTAPWLYVADGGLWAISSMGAEVHRVDPAAGPLVGYLTPPIGPPVSQQFSDGILWSVVVDPNAAPCASSRPGVDPERPYVLRGIDAATNAPAALVPLGWCEVPPSRTSSGTPSVVAAGGAVWVSRAVPSEPASETVRVDPATGTVAAVDAPVPSLVVAAGGDAVWGMEWQGGAQLGTDAFGGALFANRLVRLDRTGAMAGADELDGGYWNLSTLEADPGGVWVASARRAPRFGGALDPVLTRVTTTGDVSTVSKVRPWSIATDDHGHTWFLGTTHRVAKTDPPKRVDWMLGRVDTRTGKHLRTYRLDLPSELGMVTTANGLQLGVMGATGGSLWLRAGLGSGSLVRVTEPTR